MIGTVCKNNFGGLCFDIQEAGLAGMCNFVRPTAQADFCHWLADSKDHSDVKLVYPGAEAVSSAQVCASNSSDGNGGSKVNNAENQCAVAYNNVSAEIEDYQIQEAVCGAIMVTGVAGNTADTANQIDPNNDVKTSWNKDIVKGVNVKESNFIGPGWCEWQYSTARCVPNKALLSTNTLCKKQTKTECESVVFGAEKPCKWEE